MVVIKKDFQNVQQRVDKKISLYAMSAELPVCELVLATGIASKTPDYSDFFRACPQAWALAQAH
jgi:hypothetical protein